MSLVGKFFLHFGKEYLHTGEVVAQVDPATVLMRFDKCEHVPAATGAVMIAVSSLISTLDSDGAVQSEWEFFDTRADLDAGWSGSTRPTTMTEIIAPLPKTRRS